MSTQEITENWNSCSRGTRQAILQKLTRGPFGVFGGKFYSQTDIGEMRDYTMRDHRQNNAMNGTNAELLQDRINRNPVLSTLVWVKCAWVLRLIP